MKKSILMFGLVLGMGSLSAQYYTYPDLNAGMNPGGINTDGENPYPNTPSGWTKVWNGGATTTPTYANAQAIPFDFEFNGAKVTTYTPSTFGTVTFDNATPASKPAAYSNYTLPNADIPDNSVCALGLKPLGPLTSGSTEYMSAIITKTVGTAPNRQHWIQFNFFGEPNIDDGWTYWGIVLEETTNNIYIVDMKTLPVKGGALTSGNVKMSLGIQIDGSTAISVDGSPEVKAQQTTKNIFTAEDNSYYTFVPGTQPNDELINKGIEMDKYVLLSEGPFDVTVNVRNLGTDALSSAEVHYSVDGGASAGGAVTTSTNIPSLANGTLTSPTKWTPAGVGKYMIKAWSANPNGNADGNALNDTATFEVQVVDALVQRKMLNEVFTSSTCGPCRPGNVNYNDVISGRENHSTIKYQVWWPGTGDPYCTQEVRTRAGYYGVNSVPRMEVDGGWDGNAGSFSASLYEAQEAIPSFLKISGVAKNTWKNTISIDVELDPVADYSSTNLKLFAAIVEETTYDNKKTNGETEFEMVMKKMMPSATGMALSPMTKGTKVTKTLSHEFKGDWRLPLDGSAAQHINHNTENSIETWDDLKIVVWVQDFVTKEVIQSNTFAVASNATESLEKVVRVFPNPAEDMFNIKASSMSSEVAKVEVTNVQGQIVYSSDMTNGEHQINTATWQAGVYMVSVEGADQHFSTKVVVRN
ncbi:MAG: T9SS type A sorting domain-containing protein [Bacteroidia bacterium]